MTDRTIEKLETEIASINDINALLKKQKLYEDRLAKLSEDVPPPDSADISTQISRVGYKPLQKGLKQLVIVNNRIQEIAEEQDLEEVPATFDRPAYIKGHSFLDYISAMELYSKVKRQHSELEAVPFMESTCTANRALLGSIKPLLKEFRDSMDDLPTYPQLEDVYSQFRSLVFRLEQVTNSGEEAQRLRKETMDHELAMAKASHSVASVPSPTTPAKDSHHPSHPKIKYPTFSGKTLDWQPFWTIFDSLISKQNYLESSEKACLLFEALATEEAKRLAMNAAGSEVDFDKAVTALRERFEVKRAIYSEAYTKYFECKKKVELNPRDLNELREDMVAAATAFSNCGGLTGEQLMVAKAESRFSDSVKDKWRDHTKGNASPPNMEHMKTFCNQLLVTLGSCTTPAAPPSNSSKQRTDAYRFPKPKRAINRLVDTSRRTCPACNDDQPHPLFKCSEFHRANQAKRYDIVKAAHLCFNCLQHNHSVGDCPSTKTCKECRGRHHTMIHRGSEHRGSERPQSPQPQHRSNTVPANSTLSQAATPFTPTSSTVTQVNSLSDTTRLPVMSTATVIAQGDSSSAVTRVFLDGGSGVTLVSNRLAQKLQLRKTRERTVMESFSGQEIVSTHVVSMKLTSVHDPSLQCTVKCCIIPEINCNYAIPNYNFPSLQELMKDLSPWADPQSTSKMRVDILLGSRDISKIHQGQVVVSPDKTLRAESTLFGWVIGGAMETTQHQIPICRIKAKDDAHLDQLLSRLWELEQVPTSPAAEAYLDTFQRLPSGRYQVELPRKDPAPVLGESRPTAIRRFHQNERSLGKKGVLGDFQTALTEYATMGHAEPVPSADLLKPPERTYYLPTHGVFKSSSTTTKLRVVFDASAKSTSGSSLNDTLLPTPNLYPLLPDVICRFRTFPIALTSDIGKMFREVSLAPKDRDYHRFLIRDEETNEIKDWRMTRLTFGVASSPYLATRVLHQLAEDEKDSYPQATAILKTNFYVDDCLAGAATEEAAIDLRKDLCDLLLKAGMTLRKWRSSSANVLDSIPPELRETQPLNISTPEDHLKTLGVHWDCESDVFYIHVPSTTDQVPTKRILASTLARTYDSLGWFSPATLQLKILLQDLWAERLSWDDDLPDKYNAQWQHYKEELPLLGHHPIPRRLYRLDTQPVEIQLHGFSDASEKAYGAAIYVRAVYDANSVDVFLILSRTRVSPLKTQSIPRLELAAATLLAQLITSIAKVLNVSDIICWTDSTVVLGWLRRPPRTWKTFVSNRVSKIQDLVPTSSWRHVPTDSNPADHASRGLSPAELLRCPIWWEGPPWLYLPPSSWPTSPVASLEVSLPEVRPVISLKIEPELPLWKKFSSFPKLVRVVGICLNFVNNCVQKLRRKSAQPLPLSAPDVAAARITVLSHSQSTSWPDEVKACKSKKALPSSSSILKYSPYLDPEGLLRVGGRLNRAELPTDVRNPVLLHGKDYLTKLLIRHLHESTGHPGPSTLLGLVYQEYYVVGVRQLVKSVCKSCIVCLKSAARTSQQQMGDLPPVRTRQSPPFYATGIDYAGPITTKRGNPRKPTLVKSYICIFICMATHAIHIELSEDLSTESFLLAFERFANRRGTPHDVYSDNGTNFIGASKLLSSDQHLPFDHCDLVARTSSLQTTRGVIWHFSPARSPHFGGLWEAGVKSMKTLLMKQMRHFTPTHPQLNHILIEVEALLNSRPLQPIEDTCEGVQFITPGHFLVGAPLKSRPQDGLIHDCNLSRKWDHVKDITNQIWKQWYARFLQSLQQRSKWKIKKENFKIGDIILLKDETLADKGWPMARITDTHPGRDGLVRVIRCTLRGKTYTRGIERVVLLYRPAEDDNVSPGEDVLDT